MKGIKRYLPTLISVLMLCSCGGTDISGAPEITTTTTSVTTVTTVTETQTQTVASASETQTVTESVSESVTETETETVTETETQKVTEAPVTQTEAETPTVTNKPQTESVTKTEAPKKPAAAEKIKGKTAAEVLKELSVSEKVGQLFMTRPDALIYNDFADHNVNQVTDRLKNELSSLPLGGISMFGGNFKSPEQIKSLTKGLQDASRVPLLMSLDEEGGSVARIANAGFPVTKVSSMYEIGSTGNPEKAYNAGKAIGTYIKEYGFNVDFAPVADVLSNPKNTVIGKRSFGSDPEKVSEMVGRCIDGLHDSGIITTVKHFPGHGGTYEDTHTQLAVIDKTWDELKQCELIPFAENLDKTDMVMVAHIALPNVTGDKTPASLSYKVMTEKLRNEMGFKGVIITDGLGMNAITNQYSSGKAAVMSFKAGADILLIPAKIKDAYQAVLAAVNSGEISQERLDESVLRILTLKEKYGLLG